TTPAPSRKGRGAAPAPPARAKKLSFKDKHALETLPGRIAELEAEIAALGARLGAPGAFSRDRSSFEADAARLAAARAELEAAETRWLELELLREETNS
ncbi:MAG: ABC transporter ATP-binding protein, partial [Alphaproteobacteria bacterium]|nr:ABC transporter ATP-binding protein [Alphaproteobacteria bacterium]